ncbi:MAG: L-idonate 5-dehydrogenase [Methylobacteriaceae bacterium]|jgi:L-idonate 5-dehydrogenase|nr:L-idonate 5-dehydrogenase [Methylobacteriaceae bacterium]
MKAVVIHGAKDLRIEERPIPEPAEGEVRLKLRYVGICGSDMHYYHEGKVGVSVIREPMVPGHEVSAVIDKLGPGVEGLSVGQPVTANPTTNCGTCSYCLTGHQNLCPSLRYLGSAARLPHTQGVMQEYSVLKAYQIIPLPDTLDLKIAACVEPLGIALHAVSFAGSFIGKKVFISGAGTIGSLVAAVVKMGGASRVTISDVQAFPLETAKKLGADVAVNALDKEAMDSLAEGFDVCLEASGSTPGMNACIRNVKPGGRLIHVGYQPEALVPYPVNPMLLVKEVTACGSQRAYFEFAVAVDLLSAGRIDVAPLITGVYPLESAEEAIKTATDKSRSMKVLLKSPEL